MTSTFGPDPGDGLHRLADLVGVLDLVMEDVRDGRRKSRGSAAAARYCRSTCGLDSKRDARPRRHRPSPRKRIARQPQPRPALADRQRDFDMILRPVRYSALRTHASAAPVRPQTCLCRLRFAAKSWCWDDQKLRRLALIDRYLARSIAVPLLGTLVLAAMLLVLDKMLRLFDFVVDAGGPVSVVWRMLANLLPEYLALGIPIGLMLGILLAFRKLALSSELDALRGIGDRLRPAAARALSLRDRR